MHSVSCRFYKQQYPEIDDVVMVNVRSIAEMGAYVHLLEYDNIEGMILLSELSRRRIRSVNKLIRVGKTEPAVVIRVDHEKGYIDLSKRRVSPEDVEKCTEQFSKAKAVNLILRHVAEVLKFTESSQLVDLYEKTAWFLEERYKKSKASSYDFFKQAATDPSVFDECDLDETIKDILVKNIRQKLTSQSVKIRADIECACYGYEGIDAVKTALKAGLAHSSDDLPIKINLIAPPLYVMTTSTTDKQFGLDQLNNAINTIENTITELGGVFKIQMPPKVVIAADDIELAKQMEKAEVENMEVAGDDDEEDNFNGN